MKYQVGDILSKIRGEPRILIIMDVKNDFEDDYRQYYTLELFDMRDNSTSCYSSEHVDSWLRSMYKHFPVKK